MPRPRERPRHGGFRRATTRRWSRLGAGVAGITPLAPPVSVDRACVSTGSAFVAGVRGLSMLKFATISLLTLAIATPAFAETADSERGDEIVVAASGIEQSRDAVGQDRRSTRLNNSKQ